MFSPYLEDKRICPHCGEALHQKPYLMARHADAQVSPQMKRLFTAITVGTFAPFVVRGLLTLFGV